MLSRVGGWIAGAAATSITASLATMPFALHHFNRAAVFSVVANLATPPMISLWTTPAAAAAAVAAPGRSAPGPLVVNPFSRNRARARSP